MQSNSSVQSRRFQGQIAILTGAAAGLGEGIASRLAEEGATVAMLDLNPETLGRTVTSLKADGLSVHAYALDVSDEAAVQTTLASIEHDLGSPAKHVLPRWKAVRASEMEPVAVQNWLRDLRKQNGLANGTLVKLRNVMLVVFKHAQRYGLIPRTQEANPIGFVRQSCVSDYDPVVLTLAQCVDILANLDDMHRVLVLADAATGLRVSELLALRWSDIDWRNSCIRVSRAYVYGKFGLPKSKASQRPVPLHPLLAALLEAWRKETPYCRDTDLVFPSFRLHGEKPPRANMLVANHLQPAARKAGIGGAVGFHTLRRTLASVLVANGNDPKLVQELLRHSNVRTTLDIYAKATTSAKLEAQGWVLQQLLAPDTKSAVV